jgi:hypothetical protein
MICPFNPMIPFVVFLLFNGVYLFYMSWISLKYNKLVYFPPELLIIWIARFFNVKTREPKYSGKFS